MTRRTIEWELDHDRRLLVITFVGDVTGEMAVAQIPEIWKRHPEVISYNTLIDRTAFTGLIESSHTREIAALWRKFSGGRDEGKRTAILSRDPMTKMVAKAIFTEFPSQTYAVFTTRADALEWLTRKGG